MTKKDRIKTMSSETRAWAEHQLLFYGNVLLRVDDFGELVPGPDWPDVVLTVKEKK